MSNCKTIAICNQKGGVGKTTTTVNLGVGLAMQGKTVLLIDADPQGDLTTCLGWKDTDNLGITLATKLTDVINETMNDPTVGILHHDEGVDLVPANLELSAMEFNLVNAMSRETALRNYLSEVKDKYDYILIDCMPSLGMVTINALSAADSVIIPVQAQYLPAKGMTQLVQTISRVKNGSKYVATLTDTNGVLGNYNFSANIDGVSFSVSGNKLTVSMEKAPSKEFTITAAKKNGVRRGVVVWSDGIHQNGNGIQDVVTYAQEVSDPVSGFVKMKVSYGSCQIVKTSEDGKVDGIQFTISGNGVNQTVTTANGGKFQLDNLMPGVYTVTEQSIDKYVPQEVHRVTVVAGQVSKVNFNNVLKRGNLRVIKSSEDNLVEGVTFHLYGTSLSGIAVDEYAVTDKNGVLCSVNVGEKEVILASNEQSTNGDKFLCGFAERNDLFELCSECMVSDDYTQFWTIKSISERTPVCPR